MKNSLAEENYLKAIYKLSKIQPQGIATKSIGELLKIKPPTVSDMLKKLASKKLINYEKYKGVKLTKKGEEVALKVIRKHRLWETFLVEYLDFKWDEVHEMAEQLEHVQSNELINRLDKFLNYPKFDPHGDPIPSEDGFISFHSGRTLDQIAVSNEAIVVGVRDHTPDFLKYLDKHGIQLGVKLKVEYIEAYDGSMQVELKPHKKQLLSAQVCQNILVNENS